MRIIIISFLFILFFSSQNNAQDLLNELESIESSNIPLLPEKFLVTKKILWGKKGLMRSFNKFKLTPENRQHELKVRKSMLKVHQYLGFLTLGGMLAQGIIGSQLYKGNMNVKNTHKKMGEMVSISYFSTAAIPLFSPPKMFNEKKGLNNIKIHKILAVIHFSSMVATNILANKIDTNYNLKRYHRAAAYTAFGSYAASMIVIKF
ncbi:MAG TPA: hypothetical protein EYQ68_02425 [Cytophagales bacterium]|jgi:hypothetical protein|nr:hypothetical protein [Cytophagales bacterium]